MGVSCVKKRLIKNAQVFAKYSFHKFTDSRAYHNNSVHCVLIDHCMGKECKSDIILVKALQDVIKVISLEIKSMID